MKERVQSLQVSIENISTNSMIADPLTKGLPPKVYHEHVTHMGFVHIDDVYSGSLYLDFVFVFLM